MKAFLLALLVLGGTSFGAAMILEKYQRSSETAYVGSGARP